MILYFWNETCVPCRMMKPYVDAAEAAGAEVQRINTHTDDISQYNVMATPTFIKVDSYGNEMDRKIGAMRKPDFMEFVKERLDNHS